MSACGGPRRLPVLVLLALLILNVAAYIGSSPANAATSSRLLGACPSYSLAQPFLPWLDVAHYTLAPNGGFEQGSDEWTLTGGARVVAGNETHYVGSRSDRYSLALPAGSSATSGTTCVRTLDATMRFFAMNSGSLLSTLKVEVLYADASGASRSATVGVLLGTAKWQPTLPTLVLANLLQLPLLTDGSTHVAFRFTPQGVLSGWRIDDVYVDPLKGT